MSRNFRLPCLVTVVTILLGGQLSFTSGKNTDKSSRLQTGRISKRDNYMVPRESLGTGGLELQCKLHARNCPDEFVRRIPYSRSSKRASMLIEKLRELYPVVPSDRLEEERAISSPVDIGVEASAAASSAADRAVPAPEESLGNRLLEALLSNPLNNRDRRFSWWRI